MSTPGEIQRAAAAVQAASEEIRRAKERCAGMTEQSVVWWKGASGEALRSQHRQLDEDLRRLVSKLETLRGNASALSARVQQADDARRAEQRRLAALAAAKRK
ncbi:WXG100 family type VII secretion target [Paenibacillus sp. TRM 82003]|nr:WXG100 family type VII secretion target [Paenibacillus sp. TRM 82003]